MGFEGVVTDAHIKKIKQDFLSVLQWFKEKSLTPWYYGVKLDEANPHSLASAIGTSLAELTEILQLFNLAKMHGDQFRIVAAPESWTKGELSHFFHDKSSINKSKSPCACKSPKFEVYLKLGPESSSKIKFPKDQAYHDTPPKTSPERSLCAKRRTLGESIGHFIRLCTDPHQSHQHTTIKQVYSSLSS